MKNKIDWKELRKLLENSGSTRNATILVEMPKNSPMRIMNGIADGIYPDPQVFKNSIDTIEKQERIKKEKKIIRFKNRLDKQLPSKNTVNTSKKVKI